jgi:hypothetical protein
MMTETPMNDNVLCWYLGGGLMLIIAALQQAIVKKYVDQLLNPGKSTKEEKSKKGIIFSTIFFVVLGVLLFLAPAFIGLKKDLKEEHSKDNSVKENAQVVVPQKEDQNSQEKVIEEIAEGANELIFEPRTRRDSIFQATRERRWVFQIGDVMESEEVVADKYHNLANKENICLFKEKGDFIFFQNNPDSLIGLQSVLPKAQKVFGPTFLVKVVDLMAYCRKPSQRIVNTGLRRIGSRKEDLRLECFEVK